MYKHLFFSGVLMLAAATGCTATGNAAEISDSAKAVKNSASIPAVKSEAKQVLAKETAEPIRNDERWKKPKTIHAFVPAFARPQSIENFEAWLEEDLGADIVLLQSPKELAAQTKDVQALLGWCMFIKGDFPNLNWLQSVSAGIEDCANNKGINKDNVILTNGAATTGSAIAEWVIGSMFLLQRNFTDYYKSQLESKWIGYNGTFTPGQEVRGKTILIVGLGGIGKQIAWRAKGLGMTVTATRNSSRSGPDYVDYVGLPDELIELAKKADVVVNAAPLTEKTKNLFDKAFFDAMDSNALFINVGRGGSVVQDELITALKNGSVRAAALDVTSPEPLPRGSELWKLPNAFITPHHSSVTIETDMRRWDFIRENMRRFVKGDKIFNLVDLSRGY